MDEQVGGTGRAVQDHAVGGRVEERVAGAGEPDEALAGAGGEVEVRALGQLRPRGGGGDIAVVDRTERAAPGELAPGLRAGEQAIAVDARPVGRARDRDRANRGDADLEEIGQHEAENFLHGFLSG